MDGSALALLASDDGRDLPEKARSLPSDWLTRVTRLRKQCSAEVASAAVELLELRNRACSRFTLADQMLFTPIGLEQSTGERVARYRASRFPTDLPILDACAGIGGDAMQFSANRQVLAVDNDHASCVCVSHNCRVFARSASRNAHQVRTLCADVTGLNLDRLYDAGIRAAFLDPGRRRIDSGGSLRRTLNPEEYAPPLSWLERLRDVFPFVCSKVSPLLNDQVLIKSGCSVEFISDRGECKEALLWASYAGEQHIRPRFEAAAGSKGYRATVIDSSGAASTLEACSCAAPTIGAPATWVYEPDSAVVRAHLTPLLASTIPARLLDLDSYYLTSDEDVKTPFAAKYRVLDILPMRHADIQKRCVTLGRAVTAVKTRWMTIGPEELSKKVPGAGKDAPPAVLIVVKIQGRHIVLI